MKKFYFLLLGLFVFGIADAQIINIPDANFKAQLLLASTSNWIAINHSGNNIKIDANNDGEIQVNEAQQVGKLYVNNLNITDLTGIESFVSLTYLNCAMNQIVSLNINSLINLTKLECWNNQLSSLNVSNSPNLAELIANNNQMVSLNVSGLANLQILNCYSNALLSLNVDGLLNLIDLNCGNNLIATLNLNNNDNLQTLSVIRNQLQSIDLHALTNLQMLSIGQNQISTIDLSNQVNLLRFYCSYNFLTTIDISSAPGLLEFTCSANQFTTIDVSQFEHLFYFYCEHNPQLTSLNIKNNSNETYLAFSDNPNLQYICADDSQSTQVQDLMTQYGYVNCTANSYCTFTPGGTYYTIQGNNRYDSDDNGCDTSDIPAGHLRFAISNETDANSTISSASGNYAIPVSSGNFIMTPILENPNYFNILPTAATVSFPATASPFIQDFCLTSNGTYPDLEISILSIVRARPGFDATYKIIYKNKGTNTQSGIINFGFDDTVLDFVSANVLISMQSTNNLSWNFTNLLPFETRTIELRLNVNSSVETPPVSDGNVLNYTAVINSADVDETPIDNTFVLNQVVVNSLDPNDKTCLEGATITPAMVGKEVHYMIRFENTGTANAENIVVKDMIDTAKFDINSLIPLDGSAPFVTCISNTNKVEFIFENINLPFDDANNDGYVTFKIKTKPTLVLGDTFSNTASIYFDYNFPIVTNTATTTIAVLAKQDFDFENYFRIYPNPAKDVLHIESKKQIEISSISIYNTLGQLVLVVPNAKDIKVVDVSTLKAGNYFLKITSEKGSSNAKFIKN
jgi:hypothetical protein